MTSQPHTNLIISIPVDIKNQIDSIFTNYSDNDLAKIYLLIHQINKSNNNYQLHLANHASGLSLKNGELADILSELKTALIISPIQAYEKGSSSTVYRLIKPYNYKTQECFRLNFYQGKSKFPIWVQRYIDNGGLIKGTKYSKLKTDKTSSLADLVKQQALKISELEVEILKLKSQNEAIDENTVHTFKNGDETYMVNCWGELVIDSIYDKEEIEEEIADASSNKAFEINGREIVKRYDINRDIYTVSIFTLPGLVH